MAELDIVESINAVSIRLTAERWSHIVDGHPELTGRKDAVLSTVAKPEMVLSGVKRELLAVNRTEPGRWIVVAYREVTETDGFVVTAYVTKREPSRARTIVWRPRSLKN